MNRVRFRATLAYDGTAYYGFQRQAAGTPTIQGAVEAALERLTGQASTVYGAGRTDAGVHASGQVIAFDARWRHDPQALLRALNAHLPTDIALQRITIAAPDFHPRFAARSRSYEYRLYTRRVRQPLWARTHWQIPYPLDVRAMQQGAALLLGTRDFATFGQPPQGENTTRHVMESVVVPLAEDVLVYRVTANAFLQRMVRAIVGTLVEVGRGAMSLDQLQAARDAADRSLAGPSAPPHGLTLIAVRYDDDTM
ncbi:MAG: tRNA pseudouridine(38-40) synthase TruA [Anaerolineae bacterium]|nr:tRNA pseudouridine(38-40) synthase TruA [Anaerolineae bacterium]